LHEQPPALVDRWDAAKVGRTVVAVFAGLVALAVLLGFIRAIQTSDGTREAPVERQADPAGDEPTTPAPEEPVRITIPDDIVGRPATEVTDELVALGFVVEEDRVPDDAEPGTVLDSSPAPGDALEEGKTVNLVVSDGPGEDDEDDEGPPGKAKGHGKKEKDD
ncbi:MAG TPA: PASTA domain-containing protein, partial [Actinomycetota bacterium]|nr:PASTA domain-containing protein [Actinomycetota bacterium]